jgi:ATP-binding cassette subfamily F protein 3
MFKNNLKNKSLLMENPLLILSKVSKNFGAREIFSCVDLKVDQKDRIAIAGSNGIGKSVLLKIIVGLTKPDEGKIQRNKKIKSADSKIFGLIREKEKYEFLISDAKRKDLKEKISEYGKIVEQYENNKGYEYESLTEDILKKFDFPETDWNRKVKSLSGGNGKWRLFLFLMIGIFWIWSAARHLN